VHLVTDGAGVPLAVEVAPGQRHDSKLFESTLESVDRRRTGLPWPEELSADRGYSFRRIRRWLRRRRIHEVIPYRRNQAGPTKESPRFRPAVYRRRNAVERCVGWLKECRRVATRFEKFAVNFLAMIQLAIIRKYLKILFSDSA
jgi:transposase